MKPSDSENKRKRLQVFLSHSGACSRRSALLFIQQGRVTINDKEIREPSYRVSDSDDVCLDGKPVLKKRYQYVLFYKPLGVTTTLKDRFAEKIVHDVLPKHLRHLKPVGRLDKNTEGLLLLTNDGDMAYKLTHPKFNIDKTYFVVISKILKPEDKKKIEQGILIEGQKTYSGSVTDVENIKARTSLRLTIHEGRKRQIRLMFDSLGYEVIYLRRERQGALYLGSLKPGQWRNLTFQEIEALKKI